MCVGLQSLPVQQQTQSISNHSKNKECIDSSGCNGKRSGHGNQRYDRSNGETGNRSGNGKSMDHNNASNTSVKNYYSNGGTVSNHSTENSIGHDQMYSKSDNSSIELKRRAEVLPKVRAVERSVKRRLTTAQADMSSSPLLSNHCTLRPSTRPTPTIELLSQTNFHHRR